MPRLLLPLALFLMFATPAFAQDAPEGEVETEPVPDPNETGEDGADAEDEAEVDAPDENASTESAEDPPAGESGSREDDEEDEREDDEDRFETRAEASDDVPKVAYDAPNGSLVLERAGLAGLETRLDALVEFVDENGNGAYDLGEQVVQRLAIRDLPGRIERTGPDVADRDAVYTLPGNATLRLRFQQRADETVKYDIIVEGLAFGAPASRVAIGALSTSTTALEVTTVGGHPAIIGAGRTGEVPYMSWVEIVQVDGRDAPVGWSVHTSTSRDASSAIVYWSYPQGASIVHDPELGLTRAIRDVLGHPQAYAVGLLATLAILGGGYLLRRRWP